MIKPKSLRDHLVAANPTLRKNPDRIHVFADAGRIVSTGSLSLSFEYQYTLNVVLTDFSGHPDAIMVPLLAWLRVNQPDLMTNAQKRQGAIRFEVEFLNQQTFDLSLELDLTERVLVSANPDKPGDLRALHVPEPPDPDFPLVNEHWQLYVRDELVGEWEVKAAL